MIQSHTLSLSALSPLPPLSLYFLAFTSNIDSFYETVTEKRSSFKPMGVKVHEYKLSDDRMAEHTFVKWGEKASYEIYKVNEMKGRGSGPYVIEQ